MGIAARLIVNHLIPTLPIFLKQRTETEQSSAVGFRCITVKEKNKLNTNVFLSNQTFKPKPGKDLI